MPPSLDNDSINTPSSSPQSQPGRLTQRGSAAAGHISTRNRKKNGTAKDTGGNGVLAAVNKNAAKMSTRNAKSSAATPTESPESEPQDSPPNGNPVTSPLLDALSSATIARSSTHNTNEWADNVPAYSSSPNNLISLGDSPPILPSSYEERVTGSDWPTREQRTVANAHLASASPPANRRRPLSYQMDGASGQVPDDHRSQVSSYAARRSSMYAQHPRYAQHPPLPHQAQAHFYGAPDANLLLSPPGPGLVPGENGCYCGFDSLPVSQDASRSAEKVILTGYEGGINIHTVTKRGLKKSASLEGLRGGVYNAKILPWNILGRASQHFPLIAVVIHGPALTSGGSPSGSEAGPSPDGISTTHNGSVRGSPRASGPPAHDNGTVEFYQTTVEVYSLGTKQHVATLLSISKTQISIPTTSPLFKPPPPAGALTIHADEGNVVLASGTTGETWIFRQKVSARGTPGEFKCIGKVWTAVQHGVSVETPGLSGLADGDWYSTESMEQKQYKASILSLRGRWLAYCPSAPSSQVSLRATVPGISSMKIPGLAAQAPPQLPSINCTVETPEGESMVKQIMQAGTQALIEGTTYIGKQLGKQGAQAWNNYWNKPPSSQAATGGMAYHTQPNAAHQFPPTHGVPTQAPAVAKDPGLVSILDLESLAQHNSFSNPPHPLSTFKIPHGCSFLSFAPSGLALFTASSKGDIQCVWDLMRVHFAKSSFLKAGSQGSESRGPHVRQIAQFSRMTIARIVDVAWSSPHGERAAMVTEPGTVHILDLPASAFTWPPPRRRITSTKSEESTGDIAGTGLTPAGVATNAVNSLWTVARPLVSRRRRSSSGISAKTMTAQAGHGTQILAAGISRSVGAATGRMNEMRKSGNTKLHLPRSVTIPSKSCVLLLNRRRSDSIIVVGGGVVRFYTIKNRRADRPADKQKASRGAKYVEFRLPSLPDFKVAPGPIRDLDQVSDLGGTGGDVEDHRWNLRKSPPQAVRQHGTEPSIPQAEIESTAPYQPFHSDRRVSLHVYSSVEASVFTSSASGLLSPSTNMNKSASAPVRGGRTPWAFGGAIKTTKLDVGPVHVADDDLDVPVDHRALPTSAIERIWMVKDHNKEMEQIVVTTRRRKGISRSGTEATDADEEGFFEDDCEVLDFASQRV
ncbi:Uncharacterized protein BP5553_00703 [Venustampulla echinocandica]|uniref:WD40 repeat-like protein n=1 Tax=Venustampulla echinocandica TaxID=2656787 RepID=A0A370TYY4_9HELO|nr:Uncharacterized protein BP5553_00703 [Venustampulla echinocandica]RDL40724.1 Uncharacterized protein BP5553_00703 [Venustampulla echinocandica]